MGDVNVELMFTSIDTDIDFFLSILCFHNKLTLPCKYGFETQLTIRVVCLESITAFALVIGLSIEEPCFQRTAVKEGFGCGQNLGLTLPKTGFIIHTIASSGLP